MLVTCHIAINQLHLKNVSKSKKNRIEKEKYILYYHDFNRVFMSQVTSPCELNIWANVTSHTWVWTLAEKRFNFSIRGPLKLCTLTLMNTLGCFKDLQLDLQLKPQLNPNSNLINPILNRVGVQVGVSCLNAIYFTFIPTSTRNPTSPVLTWTYPSHVMYVFVYKHLSQTAWSWTNTTRNTGPVPTCTR